MDAAPFYAPTYFSASYFYDVIAPVDTPASPSTGLMPYNAPTYFPSAYFYGPSSSTSTGLMPYNAPTYFPSAYFYGPSSSTSTGTMPYNAPTYFPSAYFYGPSSSTSTGLMPYNAPTYFPSAYFYGPSSSAVVVPVVPVPDPVVPVPDPVVPVPDPVVPVPDPVVPVPIVPVPIVPVPEPAGQDHDAFVALLALIRATGVFEDVIFGAMTQRGQAGADTYPLAVLTPKGWEESDDFDPTSIVRRVTFTISVVVKGEDDLPRFDQLDCLSTAIKNVVDRSDLDGTCIPALTWIRSGHFAYSNHYPEQSIDLDGEFSTIINS